MKTGDVAARMGVYKTFEDVPTRYRLETFEDYYADRSPWVEWFEQATDSEWSRTQYDRAGRHWCKHMHGQGRHYALARPTDAALWAEDLLENRAPRTAKEYWNPIEQFYKWFMWHTDHPHRYHPLLMAFNECETDALTEIWNAKRKGVDSQ